MIEEDGTIKEEPATSIEEEGDSASGRSSLEGKSAAWGCGVEGIVRGVEAYCDEEAESIMTALRKATSVNWSIPDLYREERGQTGRADVSLEQVSQGCSVDSNQLRSLICRCKRVDASSTLPSARTRARSRVLPAKKSTEGGRNAIGERWAWNVNGRNSEGEVGDLCSRRGGGESWRAGGSGFRLEVEGGRETERAPNSSSGADGCPSDGGTCLTRLGRKQWGGD